jgi:cation diffusion facilitator CzcD-associated flavoprotein CzcO
LYKLTLIIGGGQAGVAMSAHLSKRGRLLPKAARDFQLAEKMFH